MNALTLSDDDITHSSVPVHAIKAEGSDVQSSEDAVQLPQSRVILPAAKPQPVKPSQATTRKTAPAVVKNNKSAKRKSSDIRSLEPRSKRSKLDQRSNRETTAAAWTESLLLAEPSRDGDDTAAVDTQVPISQPSTVASSAPEAGKHGEYDAVSECKSPKKFPRQNSAGSSELPSEVAAAVDVDSNSMASPAASDQTVTAAAVSSADEDFQIRRNGSRVAHTHTPKSPPRVQRTVFTDFCGSASESVPSTVVQAARTAPSPSFSLSGAADSSPPATTFSVPAVKNAANIRTISAASDQVRPASGVSMMMQPANVRGAHVVRLVSSSATPRRQCAASSLAATPISSYFPSLPLHSPSQSKPPSHSDLPSASKSPNTRPGLVVSPTARQLASVPSDVQRTTKSTSHYMVVRRVSKPRHSSPVSTALRCSVTDAEVQRRMPVGSQSWTTLPTRPRAVPPQPVRIRVNASQLGSNSDPTAVMNHVRGILSRTNTMLPGARIRIRYVSPPSTASQAQSVATHTSTGASEHENVRVSQLDGMADTDDESETGASSVASPGSTAVEERETSSRKRADAEEKPASNSRVRLAGNFSLIKIPDHSCQ